MKVILLQDIPGSGKRDDIITVSDGYARNFLFPKKLAVESTPGAAKEIERKRAAEAAREAQRKAEAEEKARQLKGKIIKLPVKCGETGRLYGSITSAEITEQLKAQYGIDVDKKKLELEGTIRQVGDYEVKVKLYTGIVTTMTVHVEAIGR